MSDDDSFSVIITGGQDNGEGMNQVTRYSKWGFVEDLQGMMSPRFNHGCGSYRIADSLVRMTLNLLFIICIHNINIRGFPRYWWNDEKFRILRFH